MVLVRSRAVVAVCAAVLAVAASGCSESSSSSAGKPSAVAPGSGARVSEPPGPTAGTVPALAVVGDVVTGLDAPWGLARLPDGDTLVTDRDTGTISRFGPHTTGVVEVGRVAGSEHRGEGGLLGLALSPAFDRDGLLYVYTTTGSDNRILRMHYSPGTGLGPSEVVLSGIPAGTNHDGGRIAFGPDGMLYAGTGESGDKPLAQDPASLGGKILRMTPDGKPAPGNPHADSVVYTLGHRNVQGLAWDSAGRLWASEFGQDTWDEINLIVPGANYGWPVVEGQAGDPRFVDPKAQWPTSDASPSGIAIAGDVIYMAALRGERLWQVPIRGTEVGTPVAWFEGRFGRLRTVLALPDGTLWVLTNNTDGRGTPQPGDDRVLAVRLG